MPALEPMLRAFATDLAQGERPADLLKPHCHMMRQQFVSKDGSMVCTNVYTAVQSPRGDGSEALALFTPVSALCPDGSPGTCWQEQGVDGAAAALAVGTVMTQFLAQVPWLARDFVWVVPDARCGLDASMHAWMAAQVSASPADNVTAFERSSALQQVRHGHACGGRWQSTRAPQRDRCCPEQGGTLAGDRS